MYIFLVIIALDPQTKILCSHGNAPTSKLMNRMDEVNAFNDIGLDAPPSSEELYFLSKLDSITLSDDEKAKLLGPTNSEEIGYILFNEVDLDSSPGEDGLTYRFIKIFWEWQDFQALYLDFLNFTRENGSSGLVENFGIMTVKNKKVQSDEYEKNLN